MREDGEQTNRSEKIRDFFSKSNFFKLNYYQISVGCKKMKNVWNVFLLTLWGACSAMAVPLPSDQDMASYRNVPPSTEKTADVLANPDFEKGADGWPLPQGYRHDPTGGRNGSGSLFYERTDPKQYPLPGVTLKLRPGARYRFSAWVRTENIETPSGGGATVGVEFYKGTKWLAGHLPQGVSHTADWTRVEVVGIVPADAERAALRLYLRPKVTGKAWFDDVAVEVVSPRWILYMIRPARETVPATDGRILLGSTIEGVFCPPTGWVRDEDLACRLQALVGEKVVRDVFAPVREGRIAADIGALPVGPATLRVTLLDTQHKWVLAEQSLPFMVAAQPPPSLPANACVIDARGRAIVGGKPFLPVGLYHHKFTREALDRIAAGPFNCIMPYNSMFMCLDDKKKPGVEATREVMDACAAKGMKVIFSIKDVYAGLLAWPKLKALGVEGEKAVVEKAVASFREHPALLAWYINDELPTSALDRLTARRREVNRLDPYHPTWAVVTDWLGVPAYGPTCDVLGVDPYPIRTVASRDMGLVKMAMEKCQRTVGTPDGVAVWAVPQLFNWGTYDKNAKNDRAYYEANYRDPTESEMTAMSLLYAIMGAKGFVYYSYTDIAGEKNAINKPDFERRWADICRTGATIRKLEPFLLADTDGPAVTVDVETGNVMARGFTDAQGRVCVLVAGIGPGESSAVLTVSSPKPLRSVLGKSSALGGARYRFKGTDICADILTSE